MSKVWPRTFAASEEDRDRDERYSRLAHALSFVDLSTLMGQDVTPDEALLSIAVGELLRMDRYKAPRDKLLCLVNVKTLVEDIVVAAARQGAAIGGADAFFPVLLLVVIRARLPRLASNIEYIRRFRGRSRLSGQSDYMLCNLESAAVYLDTVDWKHLKISQEEFLTRLADAGIPEAHMELTALQEEREAAKAAVHAAAAAFEEPEPSERNNNNNNLSEEPGSFINESSIPREEVSVPAQVLSETEVEGETAPPEGAPLLADSDSGIFSAGKPREDEDIVAKEEPAMSLQGLGEDIAENTALSTSSESTGEEGVAAVGLGKEKNIESEISQLASSSETTTAPMRETDTSRTTVAPLSVDIPSNTATGESFRKYYNINIYIYNCIYSRFYYSKYYCSKFLSDPTMKIIILFYSYILKGIN